ncbi:MAG: methyl-accepting chemotaxis protein [Treponema sp.]|nr:methyl-accepting chemotaxis protein [Treponema sp.]
MKLANKLPLLITVLVFVITVCISFISYSIANNAIRSTAYDSMINDAKTAAIMVKMSITAELNILQSLADRARVRSLDWSSQQSSLLFEVDNRDFLDMAIVDMDGMAHYIKEFTSSNLGDRDYIQSAFAGRQAVSDVLISRVIGKPVVMLATPITTSDTDRTVKQVLIARQAGSIFNDLFNNIGRTGYIHMVNEQGTFISHENIDFVFNQFNPIEAAKTDSSVASLGRFISQVLTEKQTVGEYTFEGKHLNAVAASVPDMGWSVIIAIESSVLMEHLNTLVFFTIIFVVGFLAIGLVVAIIIGGSVVKPLKKIQPILADISDGDLTKRLDVSSKDEIGDMVEKFNASINALAGLLSKTGETASRIQEIADELAKSMESVAGSVQHISGNIVEIKETTVDQTESVTETHAMITQIKSNTEHLNTAIEQQSQSMGLSSTATEEMAMNIKSVVEILQKNTASMDDLLVASESGRETIQKMSDIMKALEQGSDGIIEASAMIERMASQTNLLAMNAAIEAAHAGDVGRGFAVVADEIRKLAENSANQSKSIKSVLTTLKNQISIASGLSNDSQERFSLIVSLIDTVRTKESAIKNAMSEQTVGCKQILDVIRDINVITTKVKDSSNEMMNASAKILSNMNRVSMGASTMNTKIDKVESSARDVSANITMLNTIIQETRESVDKLLGDISQFKT